MSSYRFSLQRALTLAGTVMDEIERWVNARDKKNIRLRLKAIDKIKVLRLRTWAARHEIELQEVLDIVIPLCRDRVKGKRQSYGIGVSIRTLTGSGAYRMLTEELLKKYPNGENSSMYKSRLQEEQLQTEAEEEADGLTVRTEKYTKTIIDAPSVNEFIQSYRTAVTKERIRYQKHLRERWRKRKAYRNNPWR